MSVSQWLFRLATALLTLGVLIESIGLSLSHHRYANFTTHLEKRLSA